MSNGYPKRKPWSQPLADLVAPCLKPVAARHGFEEADLLLFWSDIVGARLAEHCQPIRLKWPPRAPQGTAHGAATLIVRVVGAFAIELQHQEAVVVQRVNAHVGWRCVERLALRQAPLVARRSTKFVVPSPTPAAVAQAQAITAGIGDDALKDALTRLGSRVLDHPSET